MSEEPIALVVRHRHAVRVLLSVTAALFALAIPQLEAHFDPEELVAPDDDAARASVEMERTFGADENVLLVLVQDADVLRPAVLDWSHGMARYLAALPGVVRVESLGTTPLPRALRDDELGLDDLEGDPAAEARRVVEEEAIAAAVATDPSRFPEGLSSLAASGRGPMGVQPIVSGEHPTEEEMRAIRDVVASNAMVRGRLVSAEGDLLVIAAILEADLDDSGETSLVDSVAQRLATTPAPPGATPRVAGLPAMRVTMVRALRDDQWLMIVLAGLGSVLVLVLGTRSWPGVLLPMGTVGITLAISMGGMALAGEPINLLTNVIPPLLVTIGLAEAVHMVLRYGEELPLAGGDRRVAASRTLRTMWKACFVTTFTTAVGFGALILQETAILRHFGLIAAVATMLSYAVTVLFVPASLPSFGGHRASGDGIASRGLDLAVARLAGTTARRPWLTIGVSTALVVASLWIAKDVVVDSRILDQFDPDSEMAQVTRLMEDKLDGIRGLSIGLEATPGHFDGPEGLAELEQMAAWLRAQPGVLRATTEADWLHEAWALLTADDGARREPLANPTRIRALRALVGSGAVDPLVRFVSEDGAVARIEVRLADRGASRILAMLDRFAAEAPRGPGRSVRFSGEAWNSSRGLDRIVRSLGSLMSAVLLIFGVMTLLFRSVRLGLLSIPPNALPLAMTLAYMVLRGIPLHAATVIVFTVTVGLAVDGATHVIARFREELEAGGSIEETLLRTMETSGRGVVLSSATLLVGYGALLFSAFEPVRLFGELSAVAIGASLVSQLVLLPALLAVGVPPTRRRPEGDVEPRS